MAIKEYKRYATEEYVDNNKFSGNYNDLTNVPVLELRTTYVNKTTEEMDEIIREEVYEVYSIVVPNLEIDSNIQYYMNITHKNGSIAIYKLRYDTVTTEDGVECVSLSDTNGKIFVVNSATVEDINVSHGRFVSNDTNTCAITIGFVYSIASIELYQTEIIKRLNTELLPYDVIIKNSLAVGEGSAVGNKNCTAFGEGTYASDRGYGSHAEGYKTEVHGYEGGGHAEGYETEVDASYGAHAEGYKTKVTACSAHAEGYHTIASGENQHVQGQYNIEDTEGKYAHIVGNGANDYTTNWEEKRSNAHTLDWDGNAWYKGDVFVGGDNQDNADKLIKKSDLVSPRDYVILHDQVTGNNYSLQMRNGKMVSTMIASDIEIIMPPTKTVYMENDAIDLTGMKVKIIAEDGTETIIDSNLLEAEPKRATSNNIRVAYNDFNTELVTYIGIAIQPFDPDIALIDFDYVYSEDFSHGKYQLTGWKGTYNGEPSTRMIIPDNPLICL